MPQKGIPIERSHEHSPAIFKKQAREAIFTPNESGKPRSKEGKSASLDAIDIVGESLDAHRQEFKTGFDVFRSRYPEVNIVQGEWACSGCTNELVNAITSMKQAGHGDSMKGLTVVMGNAPDRCRCCG